MKNKIKILFIIDNLYGVSGGGTETHLFNLTKHLDKEKFDCLIVAFDTGKTSLTEKIQKNVKIVHIPVRKIYSPNAFFRAVEMFFLIRSFKTDISQTFHFKSETYGVIVSRLAGCRTILSSRRDLGLNKTKYHFKINKVVNKFIDGFVVVSDAVGEFINSRENVPKSKIKTIYNGVDINKFVTPTDVSRQFFRNKLGIAQSDVVFGMVAVFRQEKKHNVMLEAFCSALKHHNNLKLLFVGGGPLLDHIREECESRGISDKVVFSGPVSDVTPFVATFDVGCLVSDSEGFSNSIIENMACGLPMIVTNVGGNVEVVEEGINGCLVLPGNAEQLAKAVIDLAGSSEKRRTMGRNSRKIVEERFSLPKMVSRYEEYYESFRNNA